MMIPIPTLFFAFTKYSFRGWYVHSYCFLLVPQSDDWNNNVP